MLKNQQTEYRKACPTALWVIHNESVNFAEGSFWWLDTKLLGSSMRGLNSAQRRFLACGTGVLSVFALAGCTSSLVALEVADPTAPLQQTQQVEAGPAPTSHHRSDEVAKNAVEEGPQSLSESPGNFEKLPSAASIAAEFANAKPSVWGLDMPGVYRQVEPEAVALTLDACGGGSGSGYDEALINGLLERQVKATLFLNKRWIEAHPDLTKVLAANPLFEIANHGSAHMPLSVTGASAYGIPGTASALEAAEEVRANHVLISEVTGVPPRFFRSGTAHYDDVGVAIAGAFGERVVGFVVNADAGATSSAEEVAANVATAPPGAIILAHMNQPQGQTAIGLLSGIDTLLARGVSFVHLDNLR